MAKNFSKNDALMLIEKHNFALKKLREIEKLNKKIDSNIKEACDNLVKDKALSILYNSDISELSKHGKGIRIKALTDSGFNTIGSIANLSNVELKGINGIGEEQAFLIRNIITGLLKNVKEDVKLKLSADDKNELSTKLIKEIYTKKKSYPLINDAHKLLLDYDTDIKNAVNDLMIATKGISYFFSSSDKKKKAESAYNLLNRLLGGNYGKNSLKVIKGISLIEGIEPDLAWRDFLSDSISYFTVIENLCPNVLGENNFEQGLPKELAESIKSQTYSISGLKCDLRNYQAFGVKYILHQEKVLLGDEMGLGKTVEAIAAMVALMNTGKMHFMVVCPASVLTNWCREIEDKSVLKAYKVHGKEKDLEFSRWIKLGGVCVTTYETISSIYIPVDFKFEMLILDEAHYIKNPQAKRSINASRLSESANRLLFMTGTPLENRVDEMINLVNILNPKVSNEISKKAFMSRAEEFKNTAASVYYRRKREDVLTELPEKVEVKEWCTLLPDEKKAYRSALLSDNYMKARRVSFNIDDLSKSSKAIRLKELVEEAKADNRKVIIFSFFLDTINKVTELLGDICVSPINGAVPPNKRQEIIDEFNKSETKFVLPAQIIAGGTGLNIQSASVVIICEPQFKPSIENQAISRVYRMGQARNVLVYRLLCEKTIDERILEILDEKQKIFDTFANDSKAAEAEIDETTFGDIIKEEIERIKRNDENND